MKRDNRVAVVLSDREKQALVELAECQVLSRASVLRRLLIQEARRAGIWPESPVQQQWHEGAGNP